MLETDFDAWSAEVIRAGAIPQDRSPGVSAEAQAEQCDRYVELVDMVTGAEGHDVFAALLRSMTAKEDYEVYETTIGAIYRFPPDARGRWLLDDLPWFDEVNRYRAGDLLSLLCNDGEDAPGTVAFRLAWGSAPPDLARRIEKIVGREEANGWLARKKFQLRPLDSRDGGSELAP